ncbi:hypothetical protein Kfla_1430 [Kribbella flavida DSM 17836]|uniref:Uncharacterized protein n=1 Tax=Kribbella flavida (strain DSM 17836 / JCM 10339 / NBRC 14399) TaxID=479435 RepID=D2PKL9_KRIFD|nr:hypothetical protein [Kribbella flavida]ADB30531.1 hypothetical protein Kfla_1430 [Kribbella flavida DSM 17836]
MTAAERLTRWLAELRGTGQGSLYARTLIAFAGVVALVVPAVQPWDAADVVPVVGLPLLVVCVVLPDSLAALCFLLLVVAGWLLRAPADVGWGTVVTGLALLLLHLASAFAAQLPSYVRIGRSALRRWLLPATVAALLGPVAAVGAALVRGAEVPGSLLVTVAALAVATAAIWFSSGQSVND